MIDSYLLNRRLVLKKKMMKLNKETLRLLGSSDLLRVEGGVTNGQNCANSLPCSYDTDSLAETCLC